MDYRVLVLDLDGTTLNGDGELEERDIAAAHALKAAGVHVTIATGRLFTGTQWVAEALGVEGTIAVMNGSELIDAQRGEMVHGHYVDAEHRAYAREVWASEAHGDLTLPLRAVSAATRGFAESPCTRTLKTIV